MKKHWLTFHDASAENEITIYYDSPCDLNNNSWVDGQAYRAGRRLKRWQDKHPCSKTPVMTLMDWSDSFEEIVK